MKLLRLESVHIPPYIFKLQQESLKFNDTSWVGAPQNWPGKFFKPLK